MNILGICASPRENGNTQILLKEALKEAQALGSETTYWTAANKDLRGCDSCCACIPSGECIIEDDIPDLFSLCKKADGIIFGSPVYFWTVTAQAKAIIDRTFCLWINKDLKDKVGGGIVTTWTRGATSTIQVIYSFFLNQGMFIGGNYDSAVTGYCEKLDEGTLISTGLNPDGTVHNDPWFQARVCAQEVVRLLKRFDIQ